MGGTHIIAGNSFPRVTTILEETKPPADIERLRQYNERISDATRQENEQKKRDGAARGTAVHTVMETWLSSILGVPREQWLPNLPQLKENPWTSQYVTFINKYADVFVETERLVWSKKGYAGTLDCIVQELDGKNYIWDWKTSFKRKKREWVTNYRLQVAAYAQAYKERTGTDIHGTRILLAVDGGTRASNFLDDEFIFLENITLFNERLNKYIIKKNYQFF